MAEAPHAPEPAAPMQGEILPAPEALLNLKAVLSMLAGILTVLSFCIGFAPIPMTALVCYPAALVLGSAALALGARALYEIRLRGEQGRSLALIGLWTGGLSLLAMVCAVTLTILAIPYIVDFFRQAGST